MRTRAHFRFAMPLAVLAGLALVVSAAFAGKHYLEFRLVSDKPMRLAPEVPLAGTTEMLTLEQKIYFTETDVDSVFVDADNSHPGHYEVAVRMNPKESERFKDFTKRYVGRRIAVLVDRKAIVAPVVREAINGDRLGIMFDLEQARADSVAIEVRKRAGKH